MRKLCRISRVVLPAVLVFAGGQVDGQTLTGIGTFPGRVVSQAYALSADGTTVGGAASNPTTHAIRWTPAGGLADLGVLSGFSSAAARGISANGSVAVGYCTVGSSSSGAYGAFYYDGGEMTDLGAPPIGPDTMAWAVSSDGQTIIGTCGNLHGSPASLWRAFTWTRQGGYSMLPAPPTGGSSQGFSISPDGSTIGGNYSNTSAFVSFGFRYRAASGYQRLLAAGSNGTNFVEYSRVSSLSLDGSIAVGHSSVMGGNSVATLWDASGAAHGLGFLPGGTESALSAVSSSGALACGWSGSSIGRRACLWSESTGLVDLNTYLPTLGIDLTSWRLDEATGISADGRTLCGTATRLNASGSPYANEGWVARLDVPAPGFAGLLFGAGLLGARRRRA